MFGPDLFCKATACERRFMLPDLETDLKQCNTLIRSKDLFICKQKSFVYGVLHSLNLSVLSLSNLTSYQINVLVTRRANNGDIDMTKK